MDGGPGGDRFTTFQKGAVMANRLSRATVSRWTLASLVTMGLTTIWLVLNIRAREAAASGVRQTYSEQTPGIVKKQDVSTTISGTRVYVGRSQTPQHDTTALSHTVHLTVTYQVDGQEYEVTGFPRHRAPQVGEEVTVYYHPQYPANAHLKERLDEWAGASANRYANPLSIVFLGAVTSAGLWFYGSQQNQRRG